MVWRGLLCSSTLSIDRGGLEYAQSDAGTLLKGSESVGAFDICRKVSRKTGGAVKSDQLPFLVRLVAHGRAILLFKCGHLFSQPRRLDQRRDSKTEMARLGKSLPVIRLRSIRMLDFTLESA